MNCLISTRSQVFEHFAMARNPAFSEKPGFFFGQELLIAYLPESPARVFVRWARRCVRLLRRRIAWLFLEAAVDCCFPGSG